MAYTFSVTVQENCRVIRTEGDLTAKQAERTKAEWLQDLQADGWSVTATESAIRGTGCGRIHLRKGQALRKIIICSAQR